MQRFLIFCCLVLAACAQPGPGSEPVTDAEGSDATDDVRSETVVVAVPEALPPLPGEKPPVPAIPLDKLVGLEDDMVAALIGQPDRREDRAPAVIWIYEALACRFGLLLYPDLETNHRTVLSYETDQPDGCAADMVRQ